MRFNDKFKVHVVVHQHRQKPLVFPSPAHVKKRPKWRTVHLSFHGGDW